MKMQRLIASVSVLMAAVTAAAAPQDVLWDVRINPRCGESGLTREQKIERSLNMAKLYHANYMTAVARQNDKPLMRFHDCMTKDTRVRLRLFDPKGEHDEEMAARMAEVMAARPLDDILGEEWRVYLKAIPDFAALPESKGGFLALPAENSVAFVLVMEGHTKDGKLITYPEINFWKISDAGRVTDTWTTSDGIAVQEMFRAVFGDPTLELKGMQTTDYLKLLGTAMEKRERP